MEPTNILSSSVKLYLVSDEALTNNISGKYHLSIQAGEGGFLWGLLAVEQNKYLALGAYSYTKGEENDLLNELKNNKWFSSVASVALAYVSDKATLVPEPLFSEKEKSRYSDFNFEKARGEEMVLSTRLKNAGCYAVFTIPGETVKRYTGFFQGIKFMHCCVPLIESVLINDKNEISDRVSLNIRSKSIELVVTRGASLQFYNTFLYTTKEDVIYYLLFTFEQLKLNPDTTTLQLMGMIEKNDSLYSIIHKYVRNVNFIPRNTHFEYSYRFGDIAEHAFYSLFSQYLCV